VPYDHAIVFSILPVDLVAADPPHDAGRLRSGVSDRREVGTHQGLFPASSWMTALAFGVVALPFIVALGILISQSGSHLTLADDLALIDLHTRRALTWKQQLGVFDHYHWNHPGPAYFYFLSVGYRVLGNGAKSMFIGAALLNGLSAIACVAVVRYRSSPARALWASVWICGLIALLAASGSAATTYSESLLGGLVSPWNPMVVTFPLLLTILLSAAAVDRSGLSLLAAMIVGSFVVQTDISTTPVVAVVVGAALLVWFGTAAADLIGLRVGKRSSARRRRWVERRHWIVGPILALGSIGLFVLIWLPPVIQQQSTHPGNLTLIARFFNSHRGTYPLVVGWRSLLSVDGILIEGPQAVMRSMLGLVVLHPALAWTATIITGLSALFAIVLGFVQRKRFAIGIGMLSLAGSAAVVISATHVVGFIFGYLLAWAIVLPVVALIGPAMPAQLVRGHRHAAAAGPRVTASTGLRMALCFVATAVCVVAIVRVVMIPPLTAASDPTVGRLATLVAPSLKPGKSVFVGDAGAGTKSTRLLDTEEFIGLVNILDERGFGPTVNHVWRTEFGPGYQTDNREAHHINLTTWDPTSPTIPGYVGHAGDMAVVVTDESGAPVARQP
jgi:hypothetical protein